MRTLTCCFGLFLAVTLVACTLPMERRAITIATDATFPPFHYAESDGSPSGFDVQLARAALKRSGLSAKLVVRPYAELFSGLQNGSHQVVAATTGITEERQRDYLFSDPYFHTCQVAIVRAEDTIQSVHDLAAVRVGAEGSGTSFLALGGLQAEGVQFEEGRARDSLASGDIDAWILDEFAAVRAASRAPDQFRILPEPVAREAYAFVFEKNAFLLKARVDAGLSVLRRDGEIAALEREFGLTRGADWPVRCAARPAEPIE